MCSNASSSACQGGGSAELLGLGRSQASALAAIAHLQTTPPDTSDTPLLPAGAHGGSPDNGRPRELPHLPRIKKKGRPPLIAIIRTPARQL